MPIKLGKKELYSIKELEKILPIAPLIIRAYIRKGKIKGHKIRQEMACKQREPGNFYREGS